MGLTTWKNALKGNIRKTDVSIEKNYLNEKEILKHQGKVTHEVALALAESDFDKAIKNLKHRK